MNSKPLLPVISGRGMAGQAIMKSLAIVGQIDSELQILPWRQVRRGDPLKDYVSSETDTILFLANPTGLHTQSIVEASSAGFKAIAADKPVCVRLEELAMLREVTVPVSVFHGYRVAWGTRTVKRLIDSGELGELFAFESRYWQSSSAQMKLTNTPEKRAWKNDPQLNGPYDALTDLGSHVVDTCLYLMGEKPDSADGWIACPNALAPHRDTHVHLSMKFGDGKRALASISKTVHGATNNFEYTVVGTKGAATWRFLNPDEVEFAAGNRTSIIRRDAANPATGSAPFHSLGWVEGYAEITHQTLRAAAGLDSKPVPTLEECVDVMDVLLNADLDSAERSIA